MEEAHSPLLENKMPATIIGLTRREVREEIPGMQIGAYCIPPADGMIPNILVIRDSFYYKPDGEGNQDRILVGANDIANCVVHMHVTSQLMYRIDRHPALFYIQDKELTVDDVMKDYSKEIKELLDKQRRWFVALVRLADDDWQRLPRHQMISDIQRTACKELGLNRPWLNSVPDEEKNDCPYCGSELLNPLAPICPSCGKVHNPERLKELENKLMPPNPVTGKR